MAVPARTIPECLRQNLFKARPFQGQLGVSNTSAEMREPEPQAAPPKRVSPQPVSGAEAKARMAHVNNDRSAYQQQGLRPAANEPWRGHAGGVDESFFWGGATGKRAWVN